MKSALVMKILLLLLAVVTFQPAGMAWATCLSCDLGPSGSGQGGQCITCGSYGLLGREVCTSAPTAEDFCKLSGASCSFPTCGGGGGTTCQEPDICPIEMESVIIRAGAQDIAAIFRSSRKRLVSGTGSQFGLRGALQAVRALTSGSVGRLTVAGSFYSVGSGTLENVFGMDDGSGYLVHAERNAEGVRVRVHDRGWAHRGTAAADVQVGRNEVLLVRVHVAGDERILAIAPRALPGDADDTLLLAHQEGLRDLQGEVLEPLRVRILDHTEFHFLAPTDWSQMKRLYR